MPFWDLRDQLLVTNRKLPARAYLDDRAVRFTDWHQALRDIASTPLRDRSTHREQRQKGHHPMPPKQFETGEQYHCPCAAVRVTEYTRGTRCHDRAVNVDAKAKGKPGRAAGADRTRP
ncbi:hypothetical protein OG896_24850 [Streptomyces sp. NBC_00669]|uniref:hypothetical protein n=1 Tax=Streptomyces sp. NBC_00669 TaxID=2976011 RepID=UPI002E3134A2|nr:hypothetical protein [Streptomyces sp. NBC_00669]